MSYAFDSPLARQLYQLLPELYRTRDKGSRHDGSTSNSEDLARYLDTHGHLLDLIHATLDQQLRDGLPDSSQDWLLPYFAKLLAASALSPHAEGRHAEIANAVPWRQRKGTLRCAEEIAEAVGDTEVEIQEGWQRVAITPRIGMPLLDPKILDNTLSIDAAVPGQVNLHPGLPVAMVDLRRYSRAVEALPGNPAARLSSFGGISQTWRQVNPHGTPCFPDSFEDASRRTVDLRSESRAGSRYHHKRLLAYMPPPTGIFPMEPIKLQWNDRKLSLYEHLVEEIEENGVTLIRNRSNRIIQIADSVLLDTASSYRIENIDFLDELSVADGGRLELLRVEAEHVDVPTFSTTDAVLAAGDCLFGSLSVGSGLAALDSCTVLGESHLYSVDALDCIFATVSGTDISGVIQSSRLPESPPFSEDNMTVEDCHSDAAVYFPSQSTLAARGVLAPGTPVSITAGASDGGEIGYYHRGRSRGPVSITGEFLGADKLKIPPGSGARLWALVFEEAVEVTGGLLEFTGSAASSLKVTSNFAAADSGVVPVIDAKDSLIDQLEVTRGLARLEYCTVMGTADCKYLQASDCLFAGVITGVKKTPLGSGKPEFENCVRYSALPAVLLKDIASRPESSPEKRLARALRLLDLDGKYLPGTNTLAAPVFIKLHYCTDSGHQHRLPLFGEPGYGVLSPHTPEAIRFGAEDGAEMGATHCHDYSLKAEAALEKMAEFLPVGIEPMLILDSRLWQVPPEIAT
jgi:hypothetical protein